ncbi:MAG: asparagine--tRNA ligase [Planctomycetes bacterium]|jgi:asparaginyl-tRNA synthetase|nr:asparagine--tRNA ligase [Planctomycetota bacterium]
MFATVAQLGPHAGREVTLRGWLYNLRSKGRIHFLLLRDGTGTCQCVVFAGDVTPEVFDTAGRLDQECSLEVTGQVREDARSPGGFELQVTALQVLGASADYPITKKEHGTDFLLRNRHLWVRSRLQHALLRIRAEVIAASQEWLNAQGFVRFDTPILTPCSAEGTTNLFSTSYFDLGPAYLAQTGQLYVEAGMMAFGKVYCFGPTFRAEKSKTRRHLTEFWMIEPEMAFADHEENLRVQESFLSAVVARVLDRRKEDLLTLSRDTAALERVTPPFPRITYDRAIELLNEHATELTDAMPPRWGEDLGAPHEVLLSRLHDKPLFVTHYPAAIKAFYMQPEPSRPEVARCADLLAPDGYGEVIGGSERIHDADLLERRIREHGLRVEDYGWYLDLRRYGTVIHSGFGMGIERAVAWIAGVHHIRETIPFPRMLDKIYP